MTDKERINDLLRRVIEFAIREMDQSMDGSIGGYGADTTCAVITKIEQFRDAGKLVEAYEVYLAWRREP